MKTVKITFPQITFEEKIVELSDDEHEKIIHDSCEEEIVDFIWKNMDDEQRNWSEGKKWIDSAVDAGYANVKEIKK